MLLPPLDADWLVRPPAIHATVAVSADKKTLTLENGLIRRTIRISPDAATVGLDQLQTGESFLRAVGPEAAVEIDGKPFSVGGLIGQPNRAFLRPDWVDVLKPDPEALHFTGYSVGKTTPRFVGAPPPARRLARAELRRAWDEDDRSLRAVRRASGVFEVADDRERGRKAGKADGLYRRAALAGRGRVGRRCGGELGLAQRHGVHRLRVRRNGANALEPDDPFRGRAGVRDPGQLREEDALPPGSAPRRSGRTSSLRRGRASRAFGRSCSSTTARSASERASRFGSSSVR